MRRNNNIIKRGIVCPIALRLIAYAEIIQTNVSVPSIISFLKTSNGVNRNTDTKSNSDRILNRIPCLIFIRVVAGRWITMLVCCFVDYVYC